MTSPTTGTAGKPAAGTWRVLLPGAYRPATFEVQPTPSGTIVRFGGRRVGFLSDSGDYQGRPHGRLVLEELAAGHGRQIPHCPTCGRPLLALDSQAQLAAGTWVCEGLRKAAAS